MGKCSIYVGLDLHKDSIAVGVAEAGVVGRSARARKDRQDTTAFKALTERDGR